MPPVLSCLVPSSWAHIQVTACLLRRGRPARWGTKWGVARLLLLRSHACLVGLTPWD